MKTVNKKIRRKPSFQQNKKCQSISRINKISSLIEKAQNYHEKKQLEQANCLYQQVLELDAENIFALNGLGLIAMDARMLLLAVEFFNLARDINPDHITVNKNLALVYSRMSRYDEAILHYIHILHLDENNAEAHGELARIYLQAGNLHHALSHYKFAFTLNPDDPRNLHGLVQLDPNSITSENIKLVEKLLLKPDLPLEARRSFYFGLGAVYDFFERYDEAFANYSVANISKGAFFDAEKHEAYITDIIRTFSPELFSKYGNRDLNNSTQTVFIVGMPRSGTTLVEQVIAAHSDVYAAGELNLITTIAKQLNMTIEQDQAHSMTIENSTAESLKKLSQFYLNDINNHALNNDYKNPLRITDKMPINFIYLGLIALLFPNAKIIHCRRNPLDVSLSCYFQNFSANHSYSYDLKNIAFFYQQYERLMAHWQQVLPVEIHTVDYEEMIADTEASSKKLVEYINLDWQDSCLEFYKTKRQVSTASLVQVRKNIYQSSVNRWQHYDKYLHYLKKILSACDVRENAERPDEMNLQNMKYGEKTCGYLH